MSLLWQKEVDDKLELKQFDVLKDMDTEVKGLISVFNNYLISYSKKVKLANLWKQDSDTKHYKQLLIHIKESKDITGTEIDLYQKERFDIYKCLKESGEECDLARKIVRMSSQMQITDELNREEELEKYDTEIRRNLDKLQTLMRERLFPIIEEEHALASAELTKENLIKFEKGFWLLLHKESAILRAMNQELREIFHEVEVALGFAKRLYEESEMHVFGKLENQLQNLQSRIHEVKDHVFSRRLLYHHNFGNLKDKIDTIEESIANVVTFEENGLKKRLDWTEKYLANISELIFELCELLLQEETQKDVIISEEEIEEFNRTTTVLNNAYLQLAQLCKTFDIEIKDLEYFEDFLRSHKTRVSQRFNEFLEINKSTKLDLYIAVSKEQAGGPVGGVHQRCYDIQTLRLRNILESQDPTFELDLLLLNRSLRKNVPEGMHHHKLIYCSRDPNELRELIKGKKLILYRVNVNPKQVFVVDINYLNEALRSISKEIDVFVKTLWELLPSNYLSVLERRKIELALRFELLKSKPMVFSYIEGKNILIDSKTQRSISKFLDDIKATIVDGVDEFVLKYWEYSRIDQKEASLKQNPQLILSKVLLPKDLIQIN